jgi:hypothetical protein
MYSITLTVVYLIFNNSIKNQLLTALKLFSCVTYDMTYTGLVTPTNGMDAHTCREWRDGSAVGNLKCGPKIWNEFNFISYPFVGISPFISTPSLFRAMYHRTQASDHAANDV